MVAHASPTQGSHIPFHSTEEEEVSVGFMEMEMGFTMISAPKRSCITPDKMINVLLKKERAPGLSMPTLYFFQQETREKRPLSKKTHHKAGVACQCGKTFSLSNTCSSTLPHLKGEHVRPGTSSTNNLIRSNTKMTMTQVLFEVSLKALKQDVDLAVPNQCLLGSPG